MKKNVLFIASILFFSCNHQQSPQQADNKEPSLNTAWSVKGCAEKATRSNTKFPDSGEYKDYPDLSAPEGLGIKAGGDSIIYSRFEQHLCCRQVKVTVEKNENIITVTEYWFGQGCKCRCSSTVHAVVGELPKGDYQVYGVATGTDPVENLTTRIKDTGLDKKGTIQ